MNDLLTTVAQGAVLQDSAPCVIPDIETMRDRIIEQLVRDMDEAEDRIRRDGVGHSFKLVRWI